METIEIYVKFLFFMQCKFVEIAVDFNEQCIRFETVDISVIWLLYDNNMWMWILWSSFRGLIYFVNSAPTQ